MPDTDKSPSELSRISSRADVPPDGRTVIIDASPEECAAVARRLGIEAVQMLHAELEVAPWRRQGLRVSGKLTARVTQKCVVSLEEFDLDIAEQVDARYAEADDPILHPGGAPEGEIMVDPLGDDAPEILSARGADLGELVVEHLAMAIDPHPRAPGVDFEAHLSELGVSVDDGSDGRESPFAALEALKRSDNDR